MVGRLETERVLPQCELRVSGVLCKSSARRQGGHVLIVESNPMIRFHLHLLDAWPLPQLVSRALTLVHLGTLCTPLRQPCACAFLSKVVYLSGCQRWI